MINNNQNTKGSGRWWILWKYFTISSALYGADILFISLPFLYCLDFCGNFMHDCSFCRVSCVIEAKTRYSKINIEKFSDNIKVEFDFIGAGPTDLVEYNKLFVFLYFRSSSNFLHFKTFFWKVILLKQTNLIFLQFIISMNLVAKWLQRWNKFCITGTWQFNIGWQLMFISINYRR